MLEELLLTSKRLKHKHQELEAHLGLCKKRLHKICLTQGPKYGSAKIIIIIVIYL